MSPHKESKQDQWATKPTAHTPWGRTLGSWCPIIGGRGLWAKITSLGALLFLSLRGEVLNIYAQVGLVMLIGLAAKNGILIVDLANQRLAEGLPALEAAREASRARLRPIVMTAISSLFGFLPLVLASGAGARSQTSLGTVVFGGLLAATLLSLFVVPVFYVVMKNWLGGGPAAVAPGLSEAKPAGPAPGR